MSERQPNPEKKKAQPLFDDCNNCEKRYQLTNANAGARHYPKQPECDYLLCICPHCKTKMRIFCGQETIQDARDNNLVVIEDEPYAEPEIYDAWIRVNGIELPKTYELTDRHEEIIRKFGETLLNIPPDLLIDGFESEHSRPYPMRWV